MVSTAGENAAVYDVRLSSVVPASITGEDKVHELSNMDLMMKLHYVKGIYFFGSEAARGLTINDLKKPLCECLALHSPLSPLSGRIRKSEDGRPFIKCNDSGVRIAEAKCSKTMDEWLSFNDDSLNDQLIYTQSLGPDCGFTPLVFVQFTWFKCGGISIGLSWAHVVGDAFSASHFINIWGQFLTGQVPPHHLGTYYNPKIKKSLSPLAKVPLSIQRVLLDADGGHWLTSDHKKMRTHSFHVTAKQLNHLTEEAKLAKPFEVISAIIWKSLAKTSDKVEEPKIVTLISSTGDAASWDKENELPSNSRVVISTIEAVEAPLAHADLAELARLIAQKQEDETNLVEQVMMDQKGIDDGVCGDFILYGARLTFVNLEKIDVYGLKMRGHQPVFASYSLSGVGDEGAILVLPGPPPEEGGRVINLILPENQVEELKRELRNDWGIH